MSGTREKQFTRDQILMTVLVRDQDERDAWHRMSEHGASDRDLVAALETRIGTRGRQSSKYAPCFISVMPRFAFWLSIQPQGDPELEGEALMETIRKVLQIGNPEPVEETERGHKHQCSVCPKSFEVFHSQANCPICSERQAALCPDCVLARTKGKAASGSVESETSTSQEEPMSQSETREAKTHRVPPALSPKRDAQAELPGTEAPRTKKIASVHKAAIDYAEKRDNRMAWGEQEVEAKKKLIELMHKHDIKTYVVDEVEIELKTEEKLKVRVKGDDDGEGGDE